MIQKEVTTHIETKREHAEKIKLWRYSKWLRLHRREVNEKVNAHLLAIGKVAFDI
jgi:hypothetical protein